MTDSEIRLRIFESLFLVASKADVTDGELIRRKADQWFDWITKQPPILKKENPGSQASSLSKEPLFPKK